MFLGQNILFIKIQCRPMSGCTEEHFNASCVSSLHVKNSNINLFNSGFMKHLKTLLLSQKHSKHLVSLWLTLGEKTNKKTTTDC